MGFASSIRVAIFQTDIQFAVLFSPIAIFCLFHVVLIGVVIHQLAVREENHSQVIGKGVLAEVVWLVPSLIVLFIWLGYMFSFIGDDPGIDLSPWAPVVIAVTSITYGIVGLGLVRWVRNPANEALGIWKKEGWREF